MTEQNVYQRLADHLNRLGMGYPVRDDLIEILKENFSELEAEIALAIPSGVIPLEPVSVDTILDRVDLSRDELSDTLERLSQKGLLFSGKTEDGQMGYALLQVGFGFPQTFFWKGDDTPHSRNMAKMVAKYFNRQVTREAYAADTKPYRYIPVEHSLKPDLQGVFPVHMMESVVEGAKLIALAHCPCRVAYRLAGRGCDHPTEVCMKFDEMARYVIDRGLAKEISKDEALNIIKQAEEAGLVHFVDNTEGEVKHNCNCCGCACWNVGSLRRRKIPRDILMATYFMRETDEEECTGCGECVEICPVDVLEIQDELPVVDEEWCIGCGVCATVCPTGAARLKMRDDKDGRLPASTFEELHGQILNERNSERAR